jgi:hypothetical protein
LFVPVGSATVSAASAAVDVTVAIVDAVYSRATPGTKAPKLAGAPSVTDSVAGTVPPTPASAALEGVTAPSPAKLARVVPAGTSTQPPLPATTVALSSVISLVGKPRPLSRLTRHTRPSLSWSFDGAGMPAAATIFSGWLVCTPSAPMARARRNSLTSSSGPAS